MMYVCISTTTSNNLLVHKFALLVSVCTVETYQETSGTAVKRKNVCKPGVNKWPKDPKNQRTFFVMFFYTQPLLLL